VIVLLLFFASVNRIYWYSDTADDHYVIAAVAVLCNSYHLWIHDSAFQDQDSG